MVTRSALQNAASIAKNILTTEAIVAEGSAYAGPFFVSIPLVVSDSVVKSPDLENRKVQDIWMMRFVAEVSADRCRLT